MTAASPSPGPTKRPDDANVDPRMVRLAALVLFGAILAGIAMFAVLTDTGEPDPSGAATPNMVPKPNSGQAPDEPGDRGGWEQLALFGIIVVTLGGISYVAVRGGGAQAKANRKAWKDAATSGRDGAIEP